MSNDIHFSKAVIENGEIKIVEKTILKSSNIKKCPNVIFDPSHYKNNTCECYDPKASNMKSNGYKWNKKLGVWN